MLYDSPAPRRIARDLRSATLLLASTLATPLSAQTAIPPNAETGFGDGRVSSFCTWTEPYVTPAFLASVAKNPSDKADPTIAYHFYLALTLGDPAEAKRLFSETAQPVMATVGGSCSAAAQADIRFAQLTPANMCNRAGLAATVPRLLTAMRYPTLRPDVPVFLGIGGKDADVSPLAQRQLARDSCAAGAKISVRLYPDLDHSNAFAASLPDALAFVQDLMAGKPAPSNCAGLPG